MPSKKNYNATRRSARPPASYSLLTEIDTPSPTWSPEQPPLLELDNSPHPTHLELPPVASEDESSPVKHEGRLLATPESRPSPVHQEVSLPPTEHNRSPTSQLGALGHTRSPVLSRCVLSPLSLAGVSGALLRTLSYSTRGHVLTLYPCRYHLSCL